MRRDIDDEDDDDSGRLRPLNAPRTSYRCKAQDCPNMGGIGGTSGVNDSGFCYAHYERREEPNLWREITTAIKADFEKRRNYGTHRAFGAVNYRDTPGQAAMRKAITGKLVFHSASSVEERTQSLRDSGDIPSPTP